MTWKKILWLSVPELSGFVLATYGIGARDNFLTFIGVSLLVVAVTLLALEVRRGW